MNVLLWWSRFNEYRFFDEISFSFFIFYDSGMKIFSTFNDWPPFQTTCRIEMVINLSNLRLKIFRLNFDMNDWKTFNFWWWKNEVWAIFVGFCIRVSEPIITRETNQRFLSWPNRTNSILTWTDDRNHSPKSDNIQENQYILPML